ncbi:tRNA-uridine aminocarboxypropyltransferase 2 isoform X3 [Tamandua tetradactyla]|uniref:tRNA-uridine aminocarboxypropyltransferase 2 isoform X3 n=1 Tax=Tamandua tetradactyla TaxID=48850 RepID=UPI00405434E5
MESQEEARTAGDPFAWSPGISRGQTQNEEERPEGGGAPAAAALDVEDGVSADGLWQLPVELTERRPECRRCSRPQKVCLCPFLPVHPLHISTHLYIIQHPAEENKVLRTVPLLAACLPRDKCKVKIGRRFSEERDPELSTLCRKSGTLILYPGAEAANLEEFILDSPIYPSTIIIIDGTWSQAKDIFYKNSLFRLPKQAPGIETGSPAWQAGILPLSHHHTTPKSLLDGFLEVYFPLLLLDGVLWQPVTLSSQKAVYS